MKQKDRAYIKSIAKSEATGSNRKQRRQSQRVIARNLRIAVKRGII